MSITAIYTSISLTAFKYLPMYYLPKKKYAIKLLKMAYSKRVDRD
jgi:hypothetical protein